MMRKFSFLNFLETFTKGNLSVDIRASRLQSGNDAYENIVDAFDKIVVDVSYSLIQNSVENSVIVKMSYLIAINCVDDSA